LFLGLLRKEKEMSYKKAMKCTGAKYAKKRKNGMYMGFSQLGVNERRKKPILGACYFDLSLGFFESEDEMRKARDNYMQKWEEETEQMLQQNPNLIIVD
jgi:hypothetical protein